VDRDLLYLQEPELRFRFSQAVTYPRDGLFLFGPVDAGAQPRQVRYGVVGSKTSVSYFREWAGNVARYIDVPPRGRLSKEFAPHHVAFPGFSEAFFSNWPSEPARIIDDITETELLQAVRISNRHEAIKAAVTLYVDRLVAHRKRDEDPPTFWYVVIPEFLYKLGRPTSTLPVSDRIQGAVRLTARQAADLAVQPTLWGDAENEAEVYKYAKNFRRQLKARLLNDQIVTQIVRETTLTPYRFLKANTNEPARRVEDPATVAWKLCTGSYYKSGGKPWQLANVRAGVCYVGLAYKRYPNQGTNACCAAQMFLSDGDGVVFRGALGPWYQPDTKQYHLEHDAARDLAQMIVSEYRASHAEDPAELFIHAKSAFTDKEWNGFEEACKGTRTKIVGVQIADAHDSIKLYRPGAYPVIRGTALRTGRNSGFLWTSGYVPRLDTYMGPDTPNPLWVSVQRGDADISTVMSDVLSLTKVNFNTCLFNDRSPVTIRFADAIGDILVSAPIQSPGRLPFKFYI